MCPLCRVERNHQDASQPTTLHCYFKQLGVLLSRLSFPLVCSLSYSLLILCLLLLCFLPLCSLCSLTAVCLAGYRRSPSLFCLPSAPYTPASTVHHTLNARRPPRPTITLHHSSQTVNTRLVNRCFRAFHCPVLSCPGLVLTPVTQASIKYATCCSISV